MLSCLDYSYKSSGGAILIEVKGKECTGVELIAVPYLRVDRQGRVKGPTLIGLRGIESKLAGSTFECYVYRRPKKLAKDQNRERCAV